MKSLNIKNIGLTASLAILLLNQVYAQTKQDIISAIWNRVEEVVVPEGKAINLYGRSRTSARQNKTNSCGPSCNEMILENCTGQAWSEAKVDSVFHDRYPLRYKINHLLFDGQNPFVRADARMLQSLLEGSWYKTDIGHGEFTEQELIEIIDQGGCIKIPIHSRLGYPHRVVIIGYHYDQHEKLMVDISNPSSTIVHQNEIICYPRDLGLTKYQVNLDINPIHNSMNLSDLFALYREAMSTMSWPINLRKKSGYTKVHKIQAPN